MLRFLRQFGLRTLLLFCTLAAVCFGTVRWHMTWVDSQHELAERISHRRGDVSWKTWGPEWLHRTFGSHYFQSIVAVDWNRRRINIEDLMMVRAIPTLEELDASGNRITDVGMKALLALPRLRKLSISDTPTTNTTLEYVGGLKNLEVLKIDDTRMTEEGLRFLRGLPKLKALECGMPISDAGISHLASIPNLKCDKLRCKNISAEGIRQIKERWPVKRLELIQPQADQADGDLLEIPTLEALIVTGGKITDEQLRNVLRGNHLKELILSDVPIGDAAFVSSLSLKNMSRLDLNRTNVTPQGLFKIYGADAIYGSIRLETRTDEALIAIRCAPNGQILIWTGSFEADDWQALTYLTRLSGLEIRRWDNQDVFERTLAKNKPPMSCEIDDNVMRILASLPELKNLTLNGQLKITPQGLLPLAETNRLEGMDFGAMPLTDEHLVVIGKMTNLVSLSMSSHLISDEGAKSLQSLQALTWLKISGCTRLTNETLHWVSKLRAVQSLYLVELQIDDEGLEHLHRMPALTQVFCDNTDCTDDGKAKLLRSLPSLSSAP